MKKSNTQDQKNLEAVYSNILLSEDVFDEMMGDIEGSSESGLSKHVSDLSTIIPQKVDEIMEFIETQMQSIISDLSENEMDAEDIEMDVRNNIVDALLKKLNRL
jgi:hypothetical protein